MLQNALLYIILACLLFFSCNEEEERMPGAVPESEDSVALTEYLTATPWVAADIFLNNEENEYLEDLALSFQENLYVTNDTYGILPTSNYNVQENGTVIYRTIDDVPMAISNVSEDKFTLSFSLEGGNNGRISGLTGVWKIQLVRKEE